MPNKKPTTKKMKKSAETPSAKKKKEGNFAHPRGMRDIKNDTFYHYQGFFEKAAEIAVYYGFRPIETPILEREEVFTAGVGEHTDIVEKEMYSLKTRGGDALVMRPEGTAPVMRAYLEHGMHTLPQPVMLYYYGPFFRHDRPQGGRYRQFYQFGIEILGTSHNIADAMTIGLMHKMLVESGLKHLSVLINSIGCRSCRTVYVRELTTYYRRHIQKLSPIDKERLKTNPLRILDSKEEETREINAEAPEAVAHLCEACKGHFAGVLEYLDAMGIPYHIDHTLVRGLDYYTRTVFEIVTDGGAPVAPVQEPKKDAEKTDESTEADPEAKTETPPEDTPPAKEVAVPPRLALAGGGRYDDLAKRFNAKRDVPAVGATIGVDRVIESPEFSPHSPRIIKKPKVYFIQLGAEAKLKSLEVIELLRKAHIPIAHALSKDKLSLQLSTAEKLAIPFVIIIGQKESVDGTVIVRDMGSRSQETVPIEKFADYLKKKMRE
ncbi:MAG: histidine--tRNA ligase [Parcubacteria group bacterium]|nr:histidine--tRNA ligase [Parcubacteria group bacterium]